MSQKCCHDDLGWGILFHWESHLKHGRDHHQIHHCYDDFQHHPIPPLGLAPVSDNYHCCYNCCYNCTKDCQIVGVIPSLLKLDHHHSRIPGCPLFMRLQQGHVDMKHASLKANLAEVLWVQKEAGTSSNLWSSIYNGGENSPKFLRLLLASNWQWEIYRWFSQL